MTIKIIVRLPPPNLIVYLGLILEIDEMDIIRSSFLLQSLHNEKPFISDVRYIKTNKKKPIVLFVHGFKGFKDWGTFNLIADDFAINDFVYVKLNLSHNGTTPENPIDFVDLDSFGKNNFEIELDDLKLVLDHIVSSEFQVPESEYDQNQIFMIGHSRGGGISILKAFEETRIKKLVTWSAVGDFSTWWKEDVIKKWKEDGVQYIFNFRTKQEMPLNYQIIENFEANHERFSIPEATEKMKIPFLIIHGGSDETVPVESAKLLKKHNGNAELYIVDGANHTFGGSHPYLIEELPTHTREAVNATLKFFRT